MDTVIWILILLTAFNFLLKQTFWSFRAVVFVALAAVVFVVAMWPYAIEQSKTQIADWLADTALMLDMAVVLTVEVALQMAFCLLSVHITNVSPVKKRMRVAWKILYRFPGVLVLPVLFFGLTQLIFALPGISFRFVAWGFGVAVLVLLPLGRWGVRWLVPEAELRMELLFLTNALVAVLGVIATVNGRTAVQGTAAADWAALGGCAGIFAVGALLGFLWRKWKLK